MSWLINYKAFEYATSKMQKVSAIHFFEDFNGCGYEIERSFGGGTFICYDDKNKGEGALLRSTGLKDKKGNFIYEGDVIEDSYIDERYFVYWNKVSAAFHISTFDGYGGNNIFEYDEPSIEVIGNIYEGKYTYLKSVKIR